MTMETLGESITTEVSSGKSAINRAFPYQRILDQIYFSTSPYNLSNTGDFNYQRALLDVELDCSSGSPKWKAFGTNLGNNRRSFSISSGSTFQASPINISGSVTYDANFSGAPPAITDAVSYNATFSTSCRESTITSLNKSNASEPITHRPEYIDVIYSGVKNHNCSSCTTEVNRKHRIYYGVNHPTRYQTDIHTCPSSNGGTTNVLMDYNNNLVQVESDNGWGAEDNNIERGYISDFIEGGNGLLAAQGESPGNAADLDNCDFRDSEIRVILGPLVPVTP